MCVCVCGRCAVGGVKCVGRATAAPPARVLRVPCQGLPLRETLQILHKIRRDKFLGEMAIFLLYFASFTFIVLEVCACAFASVAPSCPVVLLGLLWGACSPPPAVRQCTKW